MTVIRRISCCLIGDVLREGSEYNTEGGDATATQVGKTYVLDDTLLEASSWGGPCPCWVGRDLDRGRRDAVHSDPIDQQVRDGKGILLVGNSLGAERTPYTNALGQPTLSHNAMLSTLPISPAYMGKVSNQHVNISEASMTWRWNGRNATQGTFHLES